MNTLEISQKDIKSLLISSALLPVICFILGFYIASSMNNKENIATTMVTQSSEISTYPKQKAAL